MVKTIKNLLFLCIWCLQGFVAQVPEDVPAVAGDVPAVLEIGGENVKRITEELKSRARRDIDEAIKNVGQLIKDENILQIAGQVAYTETDYISNGLKEENIYKLFMAAKSLHSITSGKYKDFSEVNRKTVFDLFLAMSKAACLSAFSNNPALLALALWNSADEDKIGKDLYELVKYLKSTETEDDIKLALQANPYLTYDEYMVLNIKSEYSKETIERISETVARLPDARLPDGGMWHVLGAIEKMSKYFEQKYCSAEVKKQRETITQQDEQEMDKFIEKITNGVDKNKYKSVVELAKKVASHSQYKYYKESNKQSLLNNKKYECLYSLFYKKLEKKGYSIKWMIVYPELASKSLSFHEFNLRLILNDGAAKKKTIGSILLKLAEVSPNFLSDFFCKVWIKWTQCRIWFTHFLGVVGIV